MKRALYIIAVILVSLLIVSLTLVAVLLNSEVQTSIVRVATEELSRGLGAQAQIGQVSYRFPARLQLDDIYLEDQQGDTLLFAHQAYVHLRLLPLRERRVEFANIRLSQTKLYAHTLPNGEPNYQFLLKAFASQDTTTTEIPDLIVGARKVSIEDALVRYDEWEGRLTNLDLVIGTLSKNSIDLQLQRLKGQVARGNETLELQDMRIDWLWNDTILAFPTLYAQLPRSVLDLSGLTIRYPNLQAWDFRDLRSLPADSIFYDAHINNAILSPTDIGLLVPALSKMEHEVSLQADLQGPLDSLSLRNLAFSYNNHRVFLGSIIAVGLPDIHSTTIQAECEDLFVHAAFLQDLISDIQDKPVRMPAEVRRLGHMHYKGLLSGRFNDLTLKGAFKTALGTITTDARLTSDTTFENFVFDGRVSARKFRLGRLIDNKELTHISFDIRTREQFSTHGDIAGTVHARIKEVCYRNYCYRNILLDGEITQNTYRGSVEIDDENIQIALNGYFNFDHNDSEADFHLAVRQLAFGPLNLSDKYSNADLRFNMEAHTVGWTLDSLIGYCRIQDLMFRNGQDSIPMEELEIIMENEPPHKLLKITSDYAAMCIKGTFDYTTLLTTLEKGAIMYIPEAFPKAFRRQVKAVPTNNDLTFYLYGRQIRKLQRVLETPFFVSDYPVLKGYLNESKKMFGLQGYIPYIRTQKGDVRDITLAIHNNDERAQATISAGWYNSSYTLQTKLKNNTINLDISASDSADIVASHIQLEGLISRYKDQPVLDVHCLPGIINIADSTFFLADSHIGFVAADTSLTVQDFRFGSASQFIAADGKASPRFTDSLHIQLGHINARAIMPFVVAEETIGVGGKLSGWAEVYGLFSTPMFDADVRLDSAYLNEECIGDATVRLYLDQENQNLIIDADVVQDDHRVAHVDGLVEPLKKLWQLEIYPDSFSLGFINHWTPGILEDISGRAWGSVKVMGDGPKTWVITRAYAKDAAVTIPYTGCRYSFSDSVFMDSTSIHFSNLHLLDREGNTLYLDGLLEHLYFKNFHFRIDAYPQKCLAIDLPDKAGEFLQGQVYAEGDVHITGDDRDVKLTARAKTVGKSRFRLSVDGASTASESDFITFVDHNKVAIEEDEDEFKKKEEDRSFLARKYLVHGPKTRFQLAMDLDINPELLFQLVLNDRTGDMLQGRGDGALRFTYDDSTEDIRLMGTYTLLHGSLSFTVGNLVRRDFTLSEGSRVIWNNRPETPELDVTAKYRVTASLKDLFGDEINALTTSRTSVPVNCCLTLSGSIEDPQIRFALELPNSEDVIQTQVRSIINTDEMLMRQVVYLLVFGKFFTPEYLKSNNYTGLNETYSLLSSTITGQINSWLGKLTNVFSMGINIRSDGTGSESSQEYEAQFQLQPIDRLIINGNVGYRYNDITNRPIFGDLDVEYIITPNGKFRVKAYTHTVDKYSLRQANTQQGVGFIFKHDFNWKKDK
ncbi:MAG: translocation/assembly module TamB domain-containing protein [Paludibacteraceae bacterium]|nr:translocation/assembly module TamB domain-containing protein [Paludibacteraceae bacterium]